MGRRGRGSRPGFFGSVLISGLVVILAVSVGYAGTKYVIYPFLLNGGIKAEDGGTRLEGGESGSSGEAKVQSQSQSQSQTAKPTGSGVIMGEQRVTELTPGAVTPTGVSTGTAVDVLTSAPADDPTSASANRLTGSTAKASATASDPAPEKKPEGRFSETVYSIQFGSFGTKEGAQTEKQTLLGLGISSYIWETGNAFKVIGMPYLQKNKAKAAAGVLKSALNDVYVASMTVPFPDENQKKTLNGLLDSYTAMEQSSDQSQAAVLTSLQGPIIMMMEGLMK